MFRRFSSQFLGMNSTVVYKGSAAYLVDPGVFPAETERIADFLAREGILNIAVLFTHTHGDHISGWRVFRDFPAYGHQAIRAKPDAVRRNDVRYLEGMFRKQGIEETGGLKFPDNIEYLKDGEELEIPPYSFRFFHVPGHSTDMSVIVIAGEHLFFSGDMLIQTPVPFVLSSIRQYWESLRRIRRLVDEFDLQCLVPGHGKPARSREGILTRIRREQTYLQKLVGEGVKLLQTGVETDDLKLQLENLFSDFAQFHSHQTNVQTFLREQEDWLAEPLPAMEID